MPPSRFLIAVAVGEPGKEDVAFAGRLARHLGAAATVLSVLAPEAAEGEKRSAERFLAACVRTLVALGVPAEAAVAEGEAGSVLAARIAKSGDLLVLGAPPPDSDGECRWGRSMRALLDAGAENPILVVRAARIIHTDLQDSRTLKKHGVIGIVLTEATYVSLFVVLLWWGGFWRFQ